MNKKKWTSLFLAFVMVLGIMPFNVFAAENTKITSIKIDPNLTRANNEVTVTVGLENAIDGESVSLDYDGIQKSKDVKIKDNKVIEKFNVPTGTEAKKYTIKATIGESNKTTTLNVYEDIHVTFRPEGEGFLNDYTLGVPTQSYKTFGDIKNNIDESMKDSLKSGYKIEGYYLNNNKVENNYVLKNNDEIRVKAVKKDEPTEPTEDKIKIKNIYIYKDAVVVDVDTKDAKVLIKDGSNRYSATAKDKQNSSTYRAVFWRDYYDKDDRDDVEVYATKSGHESSDTKYLDRSSDVTVRSRNYDEDKDDDKEDDLKKINPKDLKRTDSGRRTEGTEKSYKNTKVYVYYKGDEIGSGWTDSDGKFDIKLDDKYTQSQHDDFKYYVDEDSKSKDDLTKVSPKDVKLYGERDGEYRDVKGTLKDYPNEKIYVYLNGNEKGNGTTNSDGKFDFRLSKYIDTKYSEDDLTFYVKSDKDSAKPFVTRAIAGETKVEGKDAGKDANVDVQDSSKIKLGSTTADKDGKFTVTLNRALRGGETITIIAKESGKNEVKVDYIVPGVSTGETSSKGYIEGYEDGSFKPNGNMTRAEAATMMARLMNGSNNFGTSSITRFYDANNEWYSKAVNYAVGKGIINGYPDGSFKPNAQITRAEFTQMLSKYVTKSGNKAANFNDINNHWAKAAIVKVYNNNIIDGYPDGSFRPDANITRAEAVKMLNITFNKTGGTYTNTFYDVKASDWFYNDVMKAAN